MKKYFVILTLSMVSLSSLSQRLMYEVQGRYDRRVTHEVLRKANTISDFVPGYPVNWITDYVSVEIISSCKGKEAKAWGNSNTLTADQKNLLISTSMAGKITVNVKYKYPNPSTDQVFVRNANMVLTVVPFVEAEYPGGDAKMKKYFADRGIDRLAEKISDRSEKVIVNFIVNEDGSISDVNFKESCKIPEMNETIRKAIESMPAWKSAENANGIKVKQEFEFKILNQGDC